MDQSITAIVGGHWRDGWLVASRAIIAAFGIIVASCRCAAASLEVSINRISDD